jgi:putative hydrolase of the HAD superfamily
MAQLRAIAFDLFHTLVDPEEFRPPEFRRAAAAATLLELPVEQFSLMWDSSERGRQLTLSPTVLERVQRICREFQVWPSPEVWSQIDDIMGRYQDMAILKPRKEVLQTLRRLKDEGWVLGLLSNCDEREMRSWKRSELASLFDATVFSCEAGFAKPSPEAYQTLIGRWGEVPPAESVYVGDGANDELAGARRAGFSMIVFQSGFVSVNGLRPAAENDRIRTQADSEIRGIEELPEVLPTPPGKVSRP